jgi:hypothetical protein
MAVIIMRDKVAIAQAQGASQGAWMEALLVMKQ